MPYPVAARGHNLALARIPANRAAQFEIAGPVPNNAAQRWLQSDPHAALRPATKLAIVVTFYLDSWATNHLSLLSLGNTGSIGGYQLMMVTKEDVPDRINCLVANASWAASVEPGDGYKECIGRGGNNLACRCWQTGIYEVDAGAGGMTLYNPNGATDTNTFDGPSLFLPNRGIALGYQPEIGSEPFPGRIAVAAVFNDTLTGPERAFLVNGGYGRRFSELSSDLRNRLAWWPDLTKQSGNRPDLSGNGITLREWSHAGAAPGSVGYAAGPIGMLTPSGRAAPLLDSLAAEYEFETLTQDGSGNGISLTNLGGTTQVSGVVGQAAHFNGGQRLTASNALLSSLPGSGMTWEGFVQLADKAGDYYLLSKYAGGGPNREYYLVYNHTTDRFEFTGSTTGNNAFTVSADNFGAPSAGVAYHVVCQADGERISISVDGGIPNVTEIGGDVWAASTLFEFGSQGGAAFAKADLDQWRLHRRVLNLPELAELRQGRTHAQLAAWGL